MIAARREIIYQRIADDLQGRIAASEFKDGRLPPEMALADYYGVSRITLRNALALLEQGGVIRRQKGRGTFIEKSPYLPRIDLRTLLYIGDHEGHFWKNLFLSLSTEIQRKNFAIIRCGDPAAQPEIIQRALPAASVVICQDAKWEYIARHERPHRQSVFILHLMPGDVSAVAYHVCADYAAACRLAVRCFADLGHRHIAFWGAFPGVDRYGEPVKTSKAWQGYHAAMLELGLPEMSRAYYGDGEEAVAHAMRFLREVKEWGATAIVCENDFRAAALYRACEKVGARIPDDLSILGIGDTPWTDALSPALTSINLGEDEMARLVVQFCDAPPPERPSVYWLGPRLVARQSVRRHT